MRVGVVTTQAPFIVGGAERHSANLVAALRARGHEATEISIPYKWYPGRALVDHVLAAKLIDLTDLGYPVDLMVGLKFPAYLARHPNKVFWLLHQHRQAYDLWEAGISELQRDPDGAAVRELIRAEDRAAIGAKGLRVYANSGNVAARLERYLGLASTPLYHPPPNAERLRRGAYGPTLFAPSRLGPNKRQDLMIEAMVHAPSARLAIAGPPDAPGYDEHLRKLARERGVDGRVEILGPVSDDEMIRRYAEARAVVFVPIDEDYGYITLEAMLSGRPVVTTTDAGGPLEFVAHERQGLISEPEPRALGGAFERVSQDPGAAERWGGQALETYHDKQISWDTVVATLTGTPTDGSTGQTPDAPPGDETGTTAQPAMAQPATAEPPIAAAGPSPDTALRRTIAPPAPDRALFGDLDDLLAAYDFGTWPGEWARQAPLHRPYFESHWQRYRATLAVLEQLDPGEVLDVGVVPPFLFQGLLAAQFPNATISGIWSDPRPFRQTVRARALPGRDFAMSLVGANAERDRWPAEGASVDLVLAMEILEHLACDPMHLLAEAARVLRPGGHLLVSTPNIASHRNLAKSLAGDAPYSFGLFVPVGGMHGRHNREYVPHEVRAMGEASGFETVRLLTADVYDTRIDPAVAALLESRGAELALRGETIFWLGRRTEARPGAPPEGLYHGRPQAHAGRLSLLWRDGAEVGLRAENLSRADWSADGAFPIQLVLDWQDPRGRLVHQGATLPLVSVAAGGAASVRLRVPHGAGTLTVGLFEAGAGRLAGTGRANALRLPSTEEGFLSLVAGG